MVASLLVVATIAAVLPQPGAELTVLGAPEWVCRTGTMVVASDSRGWLVDACGHVFRTEDRGSTWRPDLRAEAALNSATGARIHHDEPSFDLAVRASLSIAHAVDAQTVILGGYIGPWIIRTTDAGRTWHKIATPSDQWIYAMESVNGRVWICGSSGSIQRSDDSGATWMTLPRLPFDDSDRCMSLAFLDRNDGWASGMNGTLWKTTDGGDTWMQSNAPLAPEFPAAVDRRIVEVVRFDSRVAWAQTSFGTFRTVDAGNSWASVPVLTRDERRYLAARLLPSGEGVAVASDRPATPDQLAAPLHAESTAVFPDGTVILKAGSELSVWRDGALLKRSPITRQGSTRLRVEGAGAIDETALFAWSGARLALSDDNGMTWYEAGKLDVGADIKELGFLNETTAVARLQDGRLLRTSCRGCQWTPSKAPQIDGADLDRALGRITSAPAECLRTARHGRLKIKFGAHGCFGGNTNVLRIDWTDTEATLDGEMDAVRDTPTGGKRQIDSNERRGLVTTLVDALQRPEQPSRCFSSAIYFARVSWDCDGATGSAEFESGACNPRESFAPGVGGSTSGGGKGDGYARAIGLHNAAVLILTGQGE